MAKFLSMALSELKYPANDHPIAPLPWNKYFVDKYLN